MSLQIGLLFLYFASSLLHKCSSPLKHLVCLLMSLKIGSWITKQVCNPLISLFKKITLWMKYRLNIDN